MQISQGVPVAALGAAVAGPPLPPPADADADEGANPGNPTHDGQNHNEAHGGDVNHSTAGPPINTELVNSLSPMISTQEVPPPQIAWSTIALSPCCEGGINVKAAPAILSATRSRALPPLPYHFPPSKHPRLGLSRLESLPTEILQHIARYLGHTAARTALGLTSKQMWVIIGHIANIRRAPGDELIQKIALMSLVERDADDLVYCNVCGKLHFPIPFTNRDCSVNVYPRQCEKDLKDPRYKLVCAPLDINRHVVRWASNLHGAGKQDRLNEVCKKHFRQRQIRLAPSGGTTIWVEIQRDIRVAENTSHVLLRTRQIVSFLDLCHESGGVPSHRSIFYLVHYLKYVIEAQGKYDICRHKQWTQNPDLSAFYQLETELSANPYLSGLGGCETGLCNDDELAKRSLLSSLNPIERYGRTARIGGCCLFHEAPCEEAIAGCNLPTRGVIKSCKYCYTDYQWEVLYKDEVEGKEEADGKDEVGGKDKVDVGRQDKVDQDAPGPEDGKDHWRERVLVLTTWKNLGRACQCTDHLWDSHSFDNHEFLVPATNATQRSRAPETNATRLPRDFVPIGVRANMTRGSIVHPPARDEWASDIYRAYERKAAVI